MDDLLAQVRLYRNDESVETVQRPFRAIAVGTVLDVDEQMAQARRMFQVPGKIVVDFGMVESG